MTLKKLGRYELLRVLGKGAMGVVYEGRDPNLDRRVAIKTVKVENLSEEAAAEYEHRFRTEARSAARLQHPNIVSVYDSDRDGDVAFLVMEYIQGDDLKHHLDRGVRYSLEQSLKIIRDLLSALDYAHKQGIVHRDIKPANLLIEPGGRVKLTDFGVARIQDSGEATRTQGSMVGTLKYMAPEQVQGQKIDARADLFSVGVVLYQLLTDKRPFDGDNDFSIIHQIIGHEPPPPSSVNPKLPAALDAVMARALAKTREERFATARDFAVALQAAIRRAEDQTVVPPANPLKRVEPAASRPLSVPGTAPGGLATSPTSGSITSVTQELELVYWKDVKDSTDAEELQGFLDKFPSGIYADLARRRLRRLSGEQTAVGSGTQTSINTSTGSTVKLEDLQDLEATRLRSDASRPLAPGETPPPTSLRPGDWVDQEYTRTPFSVRSVVDEAAAAAAAAAAPVAPASGGAPPPPPAPSRASAARRDDDDTEAAPVQRKKPPVAVLAGVGALVVVGIVLALVMGRGSQPTGQEAMSAASAPDAAASAALAPASAAPAADMAASPVDAASAAALAPAPASTVAAGAGAEPASAAAGPKAAAAQPRRAASHPRPARAGATPSASEPARPLVVAPPREPSEPSSRAVPPPPAPLSSGAAAVEQCADRVFLAKELCLAEACDKPGTRNHPLCVKRREDIRLREEGKVRQGPQQAP